MPILPFFFFFTVDAGHCLTMLCYAFFAGITLQVLPLQLKLNCGRPP
jgi:hypothetical protein